MFKFSKAFFLVIALSFSLSVIVLPVQAASGASMFLNGISNADGICSHGRFDFIYTFTPDVNDEQNIDFIGFTVADGNGVPLSAEITGADFGTDPVTRSSTSYPLGTFLGAINDITARPVTVRMYETTISFLHIDGWSVQRVFDELTNTGTLLARLDFNPTFDVGFCDDLPIIGEPHNTRLRFEAVCSPDPSTVRQWNVSNPNPYQINVMWRLMGTELFDWVIVPAAIDGVDGEVFFETPTVAGDNRVRIAYGLQLERQEMRASGPQVC